MPNPINRDPEVLRQRVSRRWGHEAHWQCVYCGRRKRDLNHKRLRADHFYPYVYSRNSFAINLGPACPECNESKWDHDPVAWMEAVGVPEWVRNLLIEACSHDKWTRPEFLSIPVTPLDYAAAKTLGRLKRPIRAV